MEVGKKRKDEKSELFQESDKQIYTGDKEVPAIDIKMSFSEFVRSDHTTAIFTRNLESGHLDVEMIIFNSFGKCLQSIIQTNGPREIAVLNEAIFFLLLIAI